MANDNMGNLEKLGILVIVILVVVVGVVAITPSKALFQPDPDLQDLDLDADLATAEGDRGVAGLDRDGSRADATDLDPWPFDRTADVRNREQGSGGSTTPAPLPPPAVDPVDPVQPGPIALVPPTPTPAPEPVVVRPVTPPVTPPTPAATPRFRDYVVRSGDSLSAIAGRQSPPMRWTDIYRANPGIDPNAIKPGQVLKIPVAAAAVAANVGNREGGRTPPAAQPTTRAGTHVVRKGESLSSIAGRLLGSRKRWRAIYDANRDVISDPDRVPAGLTLRIPSLSSTSSGGGGTRDVSSNSGGTTLPRFADVPAGGGHTYEVQRGDNLSRIAARFLGDADRWREIFDANRDSISAPGKLRAGITIQIP